MIRTFSKAKPPLENIGDEEFIMRNKLLLMQASRPPFFKGGICYMKNL